MRRATIIGTALKTFGASSLVLALTLVLNSLLSLVPANELKQKVAQTVGEGTLITRTALPFAADRGPFRYDFNDCLILSMLNERRPSDVISPRRVVPAPLPLEWTVPPFYESRAEPFEVSQFRGTFLHDTCHELTRSLSGKVDTVPYHRYVHLYVPLAGLGTAAFGFANYTLLMHLLALLIPAATIVLALRRGTERGRLYASLALAYLAFSGVYRFAWSSALGPAEILLSSVILLAFLKREAGPFFYAMAGALAGALEFLTGLIPSLLVLLLGLAAIEGRSLRDALSKTTIAAGAAAAILILKHILVLVLFGAAALETGATNMAWHSAVGEIEAQQGLMAVIDRLGVDPQWFENRFVFTALAFAKFAYFSDLVAWGSRPLGFLFVLAGPVLLAMVGILFARQRDPSGFLLLLAVAGVGLWVFLLPNHSLSHALWMQRLPAWLTIILVPVLMRWFLQRQRVSGQ